MIKAEDIEKLDTLDDYYNFLEIFYREGKRGNVSPELFKVLREWEVKFEFFSKKIGDLYFLMCSKLENINVPIKKMSPIVYEFFIDKYSFDNYYGKLTEDRRVNKFGSMLAYYLARKESGEPSDWYVEKIFEKVANERNTRKTYKKDRG